MARSKKKQKVAAWGGFDLSTTGLALGVRSRRGEEAYAHTKMRGAMKWKGQPAFALEHTPGNDLGPDRPIWSRRLGV